jgi:hypothetical protein
MASRNASKSRDNIINEANSIVYELVPDSESDVEDSAAKDRRQTKGKWKDLQSLFSSTGFQLCIACVIIANAAVFGFETDEPHMFNWSALEKLFLLVFAAELCTRVIVFGPLDFYNPHSDEFEWNILDTIVVSIGVIDFFSHIHLVNLRDISSMSDVHIGSEDEGKKKHHQSFASLLRIMRLLRLVRIFRLFRFLKKLYLLTVGLTEAIRSTFWVAILMGVILYTCSVALARTLGHQQPDVPHYEFLCSKFGTVGLSMMSLFQLTASPSLSEYGDVLFEYPWLNAFLVVWVIFGSFGMIAMLTGVISESMFEKNQARMEELRFEQEEKRQAIRKWCNEKFASVPKNKNGEASLQDIIPLLTPFERLCEDLEVEYEPDDIDELPDYMDEDESGYVALPEFIHGCLSVAEKQTGNVSFNEIKHVVNYTKLTSEKGSNMMKVMLERMDKLEDEVRRTINRNVVADTRVAKEVEELSREEHEQSNLLKKVTDDGLTLCLQNADESKAEDAMVKPLSASLQPCNVSSEIAPSEPHCWESWWKSCESLGPQLSTIACIIEDAMASFEQLKSLRCPGTLGDNMEQRGQSQSSGRLPGTQSFEVELIRLVEILRRDVAASLSADRTMVLDLTTQLRTLLANNDVFSKRLYEVSGHGLSDAHRALSCGPDSGGGLPLHPAASTCQSSQSIMGQSPAATSGQ